MSKRLKAIHTYPVNDLIEHERTGGALCECICGPDVEFLEGGAVQVIHHSLDGREQKEAQDERSAQKD